MTAVAFVSGQPAAAVHSSLERSLKALDHARHCSVLWFADVQHRGLYRDLGYSSINQYAREALGFSKSRTRDFVRLAAALDDLPKVRKAMAKGELGYTKAREIVAVATPKTEMKWLKAAEAPRRELARQVKRAKRAAKVDRNQAELLPNEPTVVEPKELPVRFQVDLTPEQEARRVALVERLHKLGGAPADRAELLLEALATLVEASEKGPGGPGAKGPRCTSTCTNRTGSSRPKGAGWAGPTPRECVATRSSAGAGNATKPRSRREFAGRFWAAIGTAARPPVVEERDSSRSTMSFRETAGAGTNRRT